MRVTHTHIRKQNECLLTFNRSVQTNNTENGNKVLRMWPHTIFFCRATIFSHIMSVPILLVLIFCSRTLAMLYYIHSGEREKNVSEECSNIFDFHHRYFILSEWPLLAHYIWIWYRVWIFFSLFSSLRFMEGGRKKNTIDEMTAVVKRWWWWWCGTFEKFLTIMMSISWKVGKKVFI